MDIRSSASKAATEAKKADAATPAPEAPSATPNATAAADVAAVEQK